jgi:hypothetical protein
VVGWGSCKEKLNKAAAKYSKVHIRRGGAAWGKICHGGNAKLSSRILAERVYNSAARKEGELPGYERLYEWK